MTLTPYFQTIGVTQRELISYKWPCINPMLNSHLDKLRFDHYIYWIDIVVNYVLIAVDVVL